MDTGFVKSYTTFISMLVSARPEYLSLVLGRIAQGLTYRMFIASRIFSLVFTSLQSLGFKHLTLACPKAHPSPSPDASSMIVSITSCDI